MRVGRIQEWPLKKMNKMRLTIRLAEKIFVETNTLIDDGNEPLFVDILDDL